MIPCAIGMVVLALAAWPVAANAAHAAGALPAVSRAEYDAWRQEVSNWGRWGEDDELGTLNFITPEKKVAAAGLVKEGVSVSMALPLNKVAGGMNAYSFEHELELVIVHMGMPIFDNLNLDDVAITAAARNRWTFLFVGAPLRIPGGTGSPLNPLALF